MAFSTPNLITYFRIATAPILIWCLMYTSPAASWAAAGVFFIATVSDYADGYVARSYDLVTTLGKFLDPMADKLIVATALIMLAGMARTPHLPAWMAVVFVSREIMVTGLRAVAAAEGLIVGAEELGKYKMALQSIGIHGLLIHYTYLHIDFFAGGMFVLWLAMILTVWSGVDYYIRVIRELRPKPIAIAAKRAAR
ncbi:MAG TPA: CDP-diacylglycerol--glycerol-3-phosphate 3-phosphatidyltransferase [Candidatus Binataceae bacterium]|nr:CDP-diacylglycerol--glycerol-3-phosphate 3-phosphatidyltransferase [Candidatus Binataceae bacterium]